MRLNKKRTKPSPQTRLLDNEIYALQAELCSALAHPIRLKILDLIATEEKTNTELLEILDIPKPNLTQHLKVLKETGLVKARKDGLYQHCSLGMPKIKIACQMIRDLLKTQLEHSHSRHGILANSLFKHASS